jgi:S1-C subfamily serine protease
MVASVQMRMRAAQRSDMKVADRSAPAAKSTMTSFGCDVGVCVGLQLPTPGNLINTVVARSPAPNAGKEVADSVTKLNQRIHARNAEARPGTSRPVRRGTAAHL